MNSNEDGRWDRFERNRVAALLEKYQQPAILLHRPYPPTRAPHSHSHFGGLPRLPKHYPWPVTPGGEPLHFLAQVDCGDLPSGTAMPDRGVLFFFGRDDEEQTWDTEAPAENACRVIYALDASGDTPRRSPPNALKPIGGYYPRPNRRSFLRPGENGPNVHIGWPIQPLTF